MRDFESLTFMEFWDICKMIPARYSMKTMQNNITKIAEKYSLPREDAVAAHFSATELQGCKKHITQFKKTRKLRQLEIQKLRVFNNTQGTGTDL